MASILKNDDAEALLLDIRTARTGGLAASQAQVADGVGGAFLVFPTSVVTTLPGGGQVVFPLLTDIEPGTIVRGPGRCVVTGMVDGVAVEGTFSWVVGPEDSAVGPEGLPVEPAEYRFRRRGRPVAAPTWAERLPGSRSLAWLPPRALGRQRFRLLRQGRAAEHWLLNLTERILRQSCRGPLRRAVDHRSHVDVDDVVQRGMLVVGRLLPIYASPRRPPCSWLGMLRLDGNRDMRREVSRLDWLPPDAATVVAVAEAAGVALQPDPSATLAALVAAADRLGLRFPRVGARQVRAALGAQSLTALESLTPAQLEATTARVAPGLDAVDDQWGWAAAAVARLVTDDIELVALAGLGDVQALGQVGAQVLAVLGQGNESAAATRRRCWAGFRETGQLFATEPFRTSSIAASLAAIDESLRRAAGISGRTAAAGTGSGTGSW